MVVDEFGIIRVSTRSEDETVYHIISSPRKGPVIVVVAGVRGNGWSGR